MGKEIKEIEDAIDRVKKREKLWEIAEKAIRKGRRVVVGQKYDGHYEAEEEEKLIRRTMQDTLEILREERKR